MDVDATRVRGRWLRHAPHNSQLIGRSPVPADGRWQHGRVVRGLYLAEDTQTAIAEWYRWLAERGLPPARAIPHDHHAWILDLEVADLRTAERLQAVGLDPPKPSRRTWPPYQALGDQLARGGWAGLIAPSAARPQSLVVCVFDRAELPPPGCRPGRIISIVEIPVPPRGMTT